MNYMKRYQYLIFDLDDTLFDFKKAEAQALKSLFENNQIDFTPENLQLYRNINNELWHKLEKQIISREAVLTQRFESFFLAHHRTVDGQILENEYRFLLNQGHDLLPYAKELLLALGEAGYTLLAGSNGLGITQRTRLKESGILEFFSHLFISEEVGFEKPNPLFYQAILSTFEDISPQNTLMIGDSLTSDIQGALNMGMDSIWLNHTQTSIPNPASYEVFSLKEIAALLLV